MRIALLTEGGYPFAHGESVAWCDRLLRGLGGHEFEVYALSRSARQENGPRCELPDNVRRLRTAPLWDTAGERRGRRYGRRSRRRFAECFGELAAAVCGGDGGGDGGHASAGKRPGSADRFTDGLYGLAELARDHGPGLRAALRSEPALRTLESACRAPGAPRAVRAAGITDLYAVAERLERALRPLCLDWYGPRELAGADLCHAVGGGPAALPGLVAKRFFGTPLLISEYGPRGGREYGPGAGPVAPAAAGASVRSLLAAFQRRLTCETYARAELITSGDSQARRRQLRRGAPEERLRTVHPGLDAGPFAETREGARRGGGGATLVWTGRIEPEKDVLGLLHAFAQVRREVPEARLRLVASGPGRDAQAHEHEADCRALAERLFGREGAADGSGEGEGAAGGAAVSFESPGGCGGSGGSSPSGGAGEPGCVVVFTGSAEGFPVPLAEAMLRGRATVSTDVGLVREVIGGTGLVVPPGDARALAAGCAALLRDPERRELLGAAARERALELFTVEQNVAAFRGIYLELLSRRAGAAEPGGGTAGAGLPFARPPESRLPGPGAYEAARAAVPESVPEPEPAPETVPAPDRGDEPDRRGGDRPADSDEASPGDQPAPAYGPVGGPAPPRAPRGRRRPLSGGRRPRRKEAGR